MCACKMHGSSNGPSHVQKQYSPPSVNYRKKMTDLASVRDRYDGDSAAGALTSIRLVFVETALQAL